MPAIESSNGPATLEPDPRPRPTSAQRPASLIIIVLTRRLFRYVQRLNHTVSPSNTPRPPLLLTTEELKHISKGLPARPLRTVLCLATRLPTTQSSTLHLFSPSDISSTPFYWYVAQHLVRRAFRKRGACSPGILVLTALQSCPPLLTPLRTASPLLPPPSSPPSRVVPRPRARMPARSRPATSDGSSFPSTSECWTRSQLHAYRDARAVPKRKCVCGGRVGSLAPSSDGERSARRRQLADKRTATS